MYRSGRILKSTLFILLFALPLLAYPKLKFAVQDSSRALITWRTDDGRVLGGFIDAQPALDGSIQELFGNEHLVSNANGDVLLVKRTDYYSEFQSSWEDSGQVLFNNGNLGPVFELASGIYLESSMGELGNYATFSALGDHFLAGYSDNGSFWLREIDTDGAALTEYQSNNALIAMQAASLNDSSALLLWYKGSAVTETDTLENGIYALLYQNGQVVADSIPIKAYPGIPQYLPPEPDEVPQFRLTANPSGTGYQLFIAETDSARLRVLQLNGQAVITRELVIPIENYPGSNALEAMRVSNFTAGSRSLHLQVSTPIGWNYYLYYFDAAGNPVDSELQYSEEWLWSQEAFGFKSDSRRFVNGLTFFGDVGLMGVEHFVNSDTVTISSVNTLSDKRPQLRTEFRLSAAWPNPFNPLTRLQLTMPGSGRVQASLFNIRGQLVQSLANGYFAAGKHTLIVQGADLPSGMYWVRVQIGSEQQLVRKCLLIK